MKEVAGTTSAYSTVEQGGLADIVMVTPTRHMDSRGYFCETYSEAAFRAIGIERHFIQDNQSFSRLRGTLRGMHYQIPPFAQSKLVRVVHGSIFDVAVDIRASSGTFGKFVAVALSAENGRQLFVPAGFAHGFCTLEPNTEVIYKVDAPYSRDHERGLLWNDPGVGIGWPEFADAATLVERDREWPDLRGLSADF